MAQKVFHPIHQCQRHLSSSRKFLQLLLQETEYMKPIIEMPGPRSLPLVGTLYKYITGEYDFKKPYKKGICMKNQYGRIAREDLLPGVRMIHVFDADDVQKVLKNEGRCPRRPVPQPLKIYREQHNFSGGLATLHGEEWHRYRSHVQKYTLRPKIVASYLPSQEVIAQEFVERMSNLRQPNGQIENYLTELYRWACESVAVVCFDARLGLMDQRKENETGNEFFETLAKYFACFQDLLYSTQIHVKLQTKCWKNFLKYSDVMWDHTLRMVNDAMEKLKDNEDSNFHSKSLLKSLLSEESLKRDEVMVLVNDLLTGGVESTAHTMAFLLCNLANHPEVQEKLRQEVFAMAPPGQQIDNNRLYQMKYMNACLKESFRILPSVPYGIVRILDKNITLQGYEIPAGTVIMAHTMVTSKDDRYFEDPESYRPDRWLCPREGSASQNHPFAVLPFGFGPRMCVGRRFAEQELYLLIIHLLRRFRVRSHYNEPVKQIARTFMAPDGPLKLTFEPL